MFNNLFKKKKNEKPLEVVFSGSTLPKIPFNAQFQERFAYFKGKWLCNPEGVMHVLNFYHVREGEVISMDFNVAVIEEEKTQTITVSGAELHGFIYNDWQLVQQWYDRQTRVKDSLRLFKFKIEKIKSFKTKQEKRAGNVQG